MAFDVSLTFWCPDGIHHILGFLIWFFRHEAYADWIMVTNTAKFSE